MKQKCLLLSMLPYRIVDEKTGDVIEGLSCHYIATNDLHPVVNNNGQKGVSVLKQSFDVSMQSSIVSVPGLYDVEFGLRAIGGKPTVVPMALSYISDVELKEVKR